MPTSVFLYCSTEATEGKADWLGCPEKWLCLLVELHAYCKGFSRTIFTLCDFCLTGGLGTNACVKWDSFGPLAPTTFPLIPCFLGEMFAIPTGKAQCGSRLGIALEGGWKWVMLAMACLVQFKGPLALCHPAVERIPTLPEKTRSTGWVNGTGCGSKPPP